MRVRRLAPRVLLWAAAQLLHSALRPAEASTCGGGMSPQQNMACLQWPRAVLETWWEKKKPAVAAAVELATLKSDDGSGSTAAAGVLERHEDWLTAVNDSHARATATVADGVITLQNGLIRRSFTTTPSFGTVDLSAASAGAHTMDSALRHVYPEGALTLDGEPFLLGGLSDPGWAAERVYNPHTKTWSVPVQNGQHAFLNRTALHERLTVAPNAWTYRSHRVSAPVADLPWQPGRRNSPAYTAWPPTVALGVKVIRQTLYHLETDKPPTDH